MWESLGGVLKVIFEKHLIPAILSMVCAIITLLILPVDYWMIEKIGTTLFLALIAGCIFLGIHLVIYIWNMFSRLIFKCNTNKRQKEYERQELLKEKEKWLTFVDSLSAQDRMLIISFIKSRNKPKVEQGHIWYESESLHNTNCIIKIDNGDGTKLFKLDERFYKVMKDLYEERGSISHFKD